VSSALMLFRAALETHRETRLSWISLHMSCRLRSDDIQSLGLSLTLS
jgi:hypothetical protein